MAACAALGLSARATAAGAEPVRRVIGAATLEDVPPVAPDIHEAVQRYSFSRPAILSDWLEDGSLLIGTRFGGTQQLHRVAAPGGARTQLTFYAEPVAGAAAIPGTDRFVFARDTGGDEWFQLYAASPKGGETVSFTEPGTQNSGPVFTRDGRRMYWTRATKGSAAYAILAADLANPSTRRVVYQEPGTVRVTDVSDDGARLLVERDLSNRETRLLVVDLASGRAREIAPGAPARFEGARFGPGGSSVIAVSDRDSDVRRLVRIELATGRVTPLSPASQWEVDGLDLSRDRTRLAYTTNEEGWSRLTLQSVGGGARALPQPTALPKGVVGGLRFSPDGRRLGFSLASARSPGDVWSWDVERGGLQRWTDSEVGAIDRRTLVEPELIRFRSFDGLSVPAFVYRPAKAAPGVKTPVLISIHGGPEAQSLPGWSSTVQFYADTLGATVIVPNVRGSDGYGRRYLDLDNGPKREDSVRDIGALLDWIATRPELDARRVAVIGGSYSGYVVLACMELYGDRLAAGVESFGITDWVSFLQHTEAYRRDNRRAEYGDERDPAMRAVFDRISPLRNVGKISKPMLIQQGVNDPRVPKSESDQIVAALRSRRVPVEYLVFADEGHGFRKKPNQDVSLEVGADFLRRVLNGPAVPTRAGE